MKVNTNLRYEELEVVGKGLQALAKAQRSAKKMPVENSAEKELLAEADELFDRFLGDLTDSIK